MPAYTCEPRGSVRVTHGDMKVAIVKPARRRDTQKTGAGGVGVAEAGHSSPSIERDSAGHQVAEIKTVHNDPVEWPFKIRSARPLYAHPNLRETGAGVRITLQQEWQWSGLGGHAESIRRPTILISLRADSVLSSVDVATVEDADI